MDHDPTILSKRKAVAGCAWQSLLCLRPRRQKKKVAYSIYIHKLLNQTWSTGASCLVAAALDWLGSPQLLGDVALEATRLSRCSRRSHLSHREVLLAMKLVLLRELSKPPLGSSSCC
ncbi:PREDICTED: histone H2B.2, sperm-like [Calidris pugnax]|uniref:histone H2B.2, sperm-like n=1 Tax=Calidris pugnax TaxID=198806 RepID=UPI00071E5D30|nr:PREDICTED: histone H2B.2, sperm-like [Calidris pugnax]